MGLYVVEYLRDPAPSEQDETAQAAHFARCLAVYEVRWVSRLRARDGKRALCVFEAESKERVLTAHRSSDLPFTAMWPADQEPIPP